MDMFSDEWKEKFIEATVKDAIQKTIDAVMEENTTLQNQVAVLREALIECAHMLDVIYKTPLDGSRYIKFMEDSPCHKDIAEARGKSYSALEQTEDK